MIDSSTILCILIPSYKRTSTLKALLSTIPLRSDIQVLLHSDNGPCWQEISHICQQYLNLGLNIKYRNNSETLGLDLNIHSLLLESNSEYSLLMGDDDYFLTEELDSFISSLYEYRSLGIKSFLRSYLAVNSVTNTLDRFTYYSSNKILSPTLSTLAWVFKRSVSLAGIVLHTETACSNFDAVLAGTLLSHAYLAALASQSYETIALHIPFAVARDTWRDGDYLFGTSKNEQNFYPSNNITVTNSLAFLIQYKNIACILESKFPGSYSLISSDLSKYSYPFLSVQRSGSLTKFLSYCHDVEELNFFNKHPLYYLYKLFLVFFGEKFCTTTIQSIKYFLGKTPTL